MTRRSERGQQVATDKGKADQGGEDEFETVAFHGGGLCVADFWSCKHDAGDFERLRQNGAAVMGGQRRASRF